MKYQVIYADPPWPQKSAPKIAEYKVVDGKQIFHTVDNKSINLPYPTMTVEEIASLPVNNIIAEDSFLFIWVTNKHLPNVFKIIKAWGFNYSTTIVWRKKSHGGGMGGTFKVSTEYLLFCRRGKLKATDSIKGTCYDIKRPYVNGYPVHSKKPSFFRELIEKVSDGYSRIELFAREKNIGWDTWGNEVENCIELCA